MKANFICFKLSKTVAILVLIILLQLIFIGIGLKEMLEIRSFEQIQENANKIGEEKLKDENKYDVVENNESNKIYDDIEIKLEEYKDMPRELKGYKIVGKIEIPKLKLNSYILEETNKKSLKVSVAKLYGPKINEIGNFCIAGHNYRNNKMFGGIKKLENGDEIILTDTYGKSITYKVYKNYQTDPKDVTCLSQDTSGEREVTLITCTAGAIKRVIVKAIEEYD